MEMKKTEKLEIELKRLMTLGEKTVEKGGGERFIGKEKRGENVRFKKRERKSQWFCMFWYWQQRSFVYLI